MDNPPEPDRCWSRTHLAGILVTFLLLLFCAQSAVAQDPVHLPSELDD